MSGEENKREKQKAHPTIPTNGCNGRLRTSGLWMPRNTFEHCDENTFPFLHSDLLASRMRYSLTLQIGQVHVLFTMDSCRSILLTLQWFFRKTPPSLRCWLLLPDNGSFLYQFISVSPSITPSVPHIQLPSDCFQWDALPSLEYK